jgi:enoyl-CoA hydratase/carnithine racemase
VTLTLDKLGVATLTLNRPEKLNAFIPEMLDQWHAVLSDVSQNDAVKVIVLTGSGRAFCAGGDLNVSKTVGEQNAIERKKFMNNKLHRITLAMERLDKPAIAAINGLARGAGLDAALMCDLRIMAQSATLAESYIDLGYIAGFGGTYFLPRLIGIPRALDLLWTGRVVAAEEAERIGIVNRVVPDEHVLPAAYELAQSIAAQPMEAIKIYKRAVYQGVTMSLATHLDMVSSHMSALRDTPDHRERVAAFLARKKKS